MKIGKNFNLFTFKEYIYVIEHYQKYTDFNTLGLYRSLLENNKLSLAEKMAIRDMANNKFGKTFNFLQLKDPYTYLKVSTLGKDLTVADERQAWANIRKNQERILKQKKIKHRNFRVYSKHNCGYDDCVLNGLMIRKGSHFAECDMYFDSDRNRNNKIEKSIGLKSAIKNQKDFWKQLDEERI